jgi:hypothetical protein
MTVHDEFAMAGAKCTRRADGAAPLGRGLRRRWKPPQLKHWEGPFADPHERLPRAPEVAAERATQAVARAATLNPAITTKLTQNAAPHYLVHKFGVYDGFATLGRSSSGMRMTA